MIHYKKGLLMSSTTAASSVTGYSALSQNGSSWNQSYSESWRPMTGVPVYTIAHHGRVQSVRDHSQNGYNISAPQGAYIQQGRVVFNTFA